MIRLPDGMRDRLRLAAENAHRSLNSEIVMRLTASFEETPADGQPAAGKSDDVSDADLAALNAIGERAVAGEDSSVVAGPAWPIGREPSAGLDVDRLDRLTTIVDRTRLALGANAARELWPMLGLPPLRTSLRRSPPEEKGPDLLSLMNAPGNGSTLPTSVAHKRFEVKLPREYVSAFMQECCESDPRDEVPAAVFREAYVEWAKKNCAPILRGSVLGKFAIGLGLRGRKSNGTTSYLGCRIRVNQEAP